MLDFILDLLSLGGLNILTHGVAGVLTEKTPLRFHNTLSNEIESFVPLNDTVRMYNCGPTPYDQQHIGNLFGQVEFNVLRRALEAWGYKVKQVTNITDFGHLSGDNVGDADIGDDKMTLGLKREGLALTLSNMRKLAEKYSEIFFEDLRQLGIYTERIKFPRASDYIPEQISLIKALEEKGYAYQTSDGMYFDTSKFPGYGKLGGIDLNPANERARVEKNIEKRNSADFALWKFSAQGGSTSDRNKLGWASPWGKGFPGWHIECTAMIFTLLGKQIDIHTGGIEHIPIHHNNEIAQAEALTGKPYVKYWLHNAHITIEGKKISKSLGNTIFLHNIVDKGFSALALRYWFLTGHYRTPMNFTWDAIAGADTALTRLQRAYLELGASHEGMVPVSKSEPAQPDFLKEFYAAIANDLNTAQALARVWDMMKDETTSPAQKRAWLQEADKVLGLELGEQGPMAKLSVLLESELPQEVQGLLTQREAARKNKDFAKADDLRKEIEASGFEVKDTPEGPEITKK